MRFLNLLMTCERSGHKRVNNLVMLSSNRISHSFNRAGNRSWKWKRTRGGCTSSNAIYVLLPMKRRLARIRSRNWSDQSVRSLFYGIFILDTRERNLFVWDSTTRNPVPFNIISKSDNCSFSLFYFILPTLSRFSRESRMSLIIELQSHFLLVDTSNNSESLFFKYFFFQVL